MMMMMMMQIGKEGYGDKVVVAGEVAMVEQVDSDDSFL